MPCIVFAQSYNEALLAARRTDAQYAAQLASVQNRRLQADQAGAAFYPSATFTYSKSDATSSSGNTSYVTLQQPVFSSDRYLNKKQADPLLSLAVAELDQADNELAARVFTAMADIVRSREQIRALGVQIDGLEEQLRRSTRMRQLGQGTVTEVSDFQVRVAVAQANRVNLRNTLQASERSFTLLTGLRSNTPSLEVKVPPWEESRPLDDLVAQVRETAPAARSGKLNVQLADIASRRVVAQNLPQVNLQMSTGQRSGNSLDTSPRLAIVLSAPLGLTPYYDYRRAANDLLRTEETLRYTQETLASDLTRLYMAVISYRDEIRIRQQAVEGARLSVEANVKSYQGGVKTNIDVITSYQTLADAETALVNSRLALAEAELRLGLLLQPPSSSADVKGAGAPDVPSSLVVGTPSPTAEAPTTVELVKELEVPKASEETQSTEAAQPAEPLKAVEPTEKSDTAEAANALEVPETPEATEAAQATDATQATEATEMN